MIHCEQCQTTVTNTLQYIDISLFTHSTVTTNKRHTSLYCILPNIYSRIITLTSREPLYQILS